MKSLSVILSVALFATGCGSSSNSPTAPSGTASAQSVAGTWSGTSTDTAGKEGMTWTVTQSGNSFTGSMGLRDDNRGMMGTGTMRGTLSGHAVTFHMDVPNGGFGGMMSSCSMAMDGQATISDDGHTMTGTYAGTMGGMMAGGMMNGAQSCGGPMNDGHFTLTR
jgi:hypothetical protein